MTPATRMRLLGGLAAAVFMGCGGGVVDGAEGGETAEGAEGNKVVIPGVAPSGDAGTGCEPGTFFCDGDVAMACQPGGKATFSAKCIPPQICVSGGCALPPPDANGAEEPESGSGTGGGDDAGVAEGGEGSDGPEGFEGGEGTEGAEGFEGPEGVEGFEGVEGGEGAEGTGAGPGDAGSGDTDAGIEDAGDAGDDGGEDGGDSGVPVGLPDAGIDAGVQDAGVQDAGLPDAGFDAGTPDAGTGAAGGPYVWAKRFGGASPDYGRGVAVDAQGNVTAVGSFAKAVNFGGGSFMTAGMDDVFLARYDAQGNHVWSNRLGGPSSDFGHAIALDAQGNTLVTGMFKEAMDFGGAVFTSAGDGDVFLAKYNAVGSPVWNRRFGGTSIEEGRSVAVDAQGDILVTGYFRGTADFGGGALTSAGSDDVFLAKYDASGGHIWSKRFGAAVYDQGYGVAVDSQGNVAVVGYFYGTVDFGGGPLASAGGSDAFVAGFSAAGNHLWSKRFGDAGSDVGRGIGVDAQGNTVVTGYFSGVMDLGGQTSLACAGGDNAFLIKLDGSGNVNWGRCLGGTGGDRGFGVGLDAQGGAVVTGAFQGAADFGGGPLTSAGNYDIFVAKYGADGQHVWSKGFGGPNSDEGASVRLDGQGNAVVTGQFNGAVDFGGGALGNSGGYDIFLLKLGP